MKSIKWGIIGCGDVTEVKSGPAFNLVNHSSLEAVMRRDATKARDYASRHGVPKWYDDAFELIRDPEVNAVYVATPPVFHEEFTLAALQARKPVYVEKPMAMNAAGCQRMMKFAREENVKLSVAHYRRALPLYIKVKELLESKVIGEILFINCQVLQPPRSGLIAHTAANWRVDPAVSGGGLFHDLAPHQLDLMLYYFGIPKKACGYSANRYQLNKAADIVSGNLQFENGIVFNGTWCFSVPPDVARDSCEIVGTLGTITFPFFGNECTLKIQGKELRFPLEHPRHVQQPMIERVVQYFLGEGSNPCSGEEATVVMQIMDDFTGKPDTPATHRHGA